jgi:hypothetical protein
MDIRAPHRRALDIMLAEVITGTFPAGDPTP